jgi:16S rRNA (uracil1498-N3)-methyltransferase
LTELGVKTVTPLVAERTQRPPSEAQLEKLRRGVIEACKQSGRNELLRITEPQPAKNYFAVAHNTVRLIAHPSSDAISLSQIPDATEVKAAIGPEGGWTDDEVRIAIEHGFESVDLGRRIYRIETAATVVASVLAT